MPRHYDLIVMGSGPAGSTAAVKAAERGRSVAMFDTREFGGTCALRGCNPKKVYVNAGRLVDQARRSEGKLLGRVQVDLDWSRLLAFKREFTEPVRQGKRQSLEDKGISTFAGSAKFVDPASVQFQGETFTAERFFIATGARPVRLDIEGEDLLTHSDDFLELERLPRRVAFVGGGYISMEFAHVAEANGCEVVIVERADHALFGFDPDLVGLLVDFLSERRIKFITQAEVTSISKLEAGFEVTFRQDDSERNLDADLVVHGAGRVPSLDGLDLESGGIESNPDGIRVDEFMRSVSNRAVYSAGDCAATDEPKLTPAANREAEIAIENMLQDRPRHRLEGSLIPAVAFTAPCLAQVGMSEAEARNSGRDIEIRHEDVSTWGSVRKTGVECAAYKIIIDRSNDTILGAHLLGPGAEETINLFALAMKCGLTTCDLKATSFAFPTFAHDVGRML